VEKKYLNSAAIRVIRLLLLSFLLGACGSSQLTPAGPTPAPARFRSETHHLEAGLPESWAASEGPESLTPHLEGLVAFNSWGQEGFWARQVETQTASGLSFSYSPEIILDQIPPGGAYAVLVHIAGGPPLAPEDYGPEYERQDLGDLWAGWDCRETTPFSAGFYKWGRSLRLEVYCKAGSSDETVSELDQVLDSWRFDRVPAGDVGWATVSARELLPPEANPRRFPILAGGPTESYIQDRDILWKTRADRLAGEVVVVTYSLGWDVPETGLVGGDCLPESCHWWQYEARPDGEVVLVEEGGAALPIELPDVTSTPTRTGTSTPTHRPPTPTPSATPPPQLLACPEDQPGQAIREGPVEVLYANGDRLWSWDPDSRAKTEIDLPADAAFPHLSPDGRFVAYLVEGQAYDRLEDPVEVIPLWLFDRQDGDSRQVAAFQTAETRRQFPESPRITLKMRWLQSDSGLAQGHWLLVEVFPEPWGEGCCGPRGDLYLVNVETGGFQRILEGEEYHFYSARPNGRQVAALDMEGRLYLIEVPPAGKVEPLEFDLPGNPWLAGPPSYSPDGAYLAFQTEKGLAVVESAGREVHELEIVNPCQDCYWGPGLRVTWQPDGHEFYITTSLDDKFDQRAETTLIQIRIEDGLKAEPVTTLQAHPFTFIFSPGHRYLSYWNQPEWDDIDAGKAEMNWVSLHLVDLQELEPRLYAEEFVLRLISWSPDGQRFLYTYSPFGGPNPVRKMLSLGNVCEPPRELIVPEGSLIEETIWLDADRFLAWTVPSDGIPDRYRAGLYLYDLEREAGPVHIDDVVIDLLEPYGSRQVVVGGEYLE
jgi:hypothetical protein